MVAVFLDQVGTLAEPCVVFGVVAAGFGNIVAQVNEHLIAYPFTVINLRILDHFLQSGVQIHAVVFQLQIKCLMIDTGAGIDQLIIGNLQPIRQHMGSALNTVAQTGDVHVGILLHGVAQHGHGVGIVQEHRPGTVGFDVPADFQQQGDVTQSAENTGNTARIANVGIHTVLLGNLDIMSPDVNAAVEHGAKHTVRALEGFRPVCSGSDLAVRAFHGFLDPLAYLTDIFQIIGIAIHQSNLAILECREGQQVAHTACGELQASCANKRKFFHRSASFLFKIHFHYTVIMLNSNTKSGRKYRQNSCMCYNG